ncbi:MAG: transposase [Spirochaetales bacterium]|nr:transposase [Spirochaetales bacterium]
MRKKRFILQDAKYHIIARANRQEMIFGSSELKEMFLDVVKRARKKYRFVIYNFCILDTHFHWIIKPLKGENLSRIMQWILSVFAIKYNQNFKLIGHVFYDRFKSIIIHDFRQYVATFIYIMENPVKANIVQHPEDYFYNGISFMKKGWYEVVNPPDLMIKIVLPGIE